MEVIKKDALPPETITVAWEVVPVEWTGVTLYEITHDDWTKEVSTKRNFEALILYREEKKKELSDKCDAEILKNKTILVKIWKKK